ncbi:MAG: carboxypeptidase-like regulatory domain-containing protein [Pirellulaceae bacterium]
MHIAFALILLVVCFPTHPTQAQQPLTETESRRLLIDGEVLNADTNEPVENFRVIPGVRYNRLPGSRGNVAVWQPHMIREMTGGVFQWPRTRGYDEMRFRVEADGFRPATTTWLGKGGPHLRMKIHMRPDNGIEGVIARPDGSLAAGAILAIGLPNRGIRLSELTVAGHDEKTLDRLSDQWRRPLTIQTNDHGEFVLPYESDPSAVICIVHESGYLEENFLDWVSQNEDASDPLIVILEPWAKIKGCVLWKDQPGVGEDIKLTIHRHEPYPGLVESFVKTTTDQQGNFLFAHVPPGSVHLSHFITDSNGESALEYPREHVTLKPGQTEVVNFGGVGTDVVGKLTGLDSYEGVTLSIRPPSPDVWNMQRFGEKALANRVQKAYAAFQNLDYAPLYFRESLSVNKDGSFRIKDVMTGQYNVWVHGASGSSQFSLNSSQKEPLDIGEIKVDPAPQVNLQLPALQQGN